MRLVKVLLAAVVLVVSGVGTAVAAPVSRPAIDPASLTNGGRPCVSGSATAPLLGYFSNLLEAVGTSSGPNTQLDYTFAVWPSAKPSATTTYPASTDLGRQLARVTLPKAALVSGGTYSWRVRATSNAGTSPWSPTCRFRVDTVAPPAPTITSNYPPSGTGDSPIGERATFTFSAGGNRDAAGYAYEWGDILPVPVCVYGGPDGQLVCPADPLAASDVVRAPGPGRPTTVVLDPPSFGFNRLTVATLDAAGNESSQVTYQFDVPYSSPTVTVAGRQAVCGRSVTLSFSPAEGVTGVSSYEVTFQGRPTVSVPAGADGTATGTVPVLSGDRFAEVVSVSANGFRSTQQFLRLDIRPEPEVASDVYTDSGQPVGGIGVPGTFTFSGAFDETWPPVRYVYSVDGGPTQRVDVDPSTLEARATWAPTHTGTTTLTVRSVGADGAVSTSCAHAYTFVVAG